MVRRGGVRLEIDADGGLAVVAGAQRQQLGRADAVAVASAEALARQLARLPAGRRGRRRRGPLRWDATLPALLGSATPPRSTSTALAAAPAARPAARADRDRRRRRVVELDIKEAAQDGWARTGC